jgi:hypothetical protein
MSKAKPIEIDLCTGGTKWATLSKNQDGTNQLRIAVTEPQIEQYVGGLVPFDNDERLNIVKENSHVYIRDRNGNTRFTLKMNSKGEITDVCHPSVTLEVILFGGGSQANDPVQPGTSMFRLGLKK